jgi:hypothetical protein
MVLHVLRENATDACSQWCWRRLWCYKETVMVLERKLTCVGNGCGVTKKRLWCSRENSRVLETVVVLQMNGYGVRE